jgi:hypothetical protein
MPGKEPFSLKSARRAERRLGEMMEAETKNVGTRGNIVSFRERGILITIS